MPSKSKPIPLTEFVSLAAKANFENYLDGGTVNYVSLEWPSIIYGLPEWELHSKVSKEYERIRDEHYSSVLSSQPCK